tara:strand:+ start:28 stop:507 length:480 start_codon:yes stop_codon:yes gene_type:complete
VIANGKRAIIANIERKAIIVVLLWFFVRCFAMSKEQDVKIADASNARVPISITLNPGRKINRVPVSPKRTAIMRYRYNGSFRKIIAPMIVNIVDVNPSAETSATGIRVIEKNHNITAIPWMIPLVANNPIGLDLMPQNPSLITIGITRIEPKTYRMNAA